MARREAKEEEKVVTNKMMAQREGERVYTMKFFFYQTRGESSLPLSLLYLYIYSQKISKNIEKCKIPFRNKFIL